ncbi:MAG: hypothetical protein COV08_00725 [Candidatus Vogelbacteria bacterium CG10_big_fil_rev_8_21_14_0_10_49_38]|uniref:Uncharacterized protein n=1 Tax=Candidatus Vogelbacteria bacterium CG10_big_fil_rev_8_21_14_0_10_49_38 TaxID=1975043 RepID=A0A2H0RIN5_9BACT|nr:MAG: hypothetical protein BK006_00735 [bacterium CG10_49_38]PIR46276.1 MAG: hypothetical protein COV08_00725 [Candidatus Vogelbacteria bacterium CG10_big_fil_rev_8_21_14_0_10_49_38]
MAKCFHCDSTVGESDTMCQSCGYLWPGNPNFAHPPLTWSLKFLVLTGSKKDLGYDQDYLVEM